jgi:tetratricopeptide (TPR) repeat protein/transcriptional regulator with XRE-family HTH domain
MKNRDQARPNHLLRKAREERGMSEADLAEAIKVSKVTISRWERGLASPRTYYYIRLCDALGKATIDELGLGSEQEEPEQLPPPGADELASDETERSSAEDTRVPSLWNVPNMRNRFFTGREAVLQELHRNLQKSNTMALTQAIRGLGGIGKTHAAAEYAYRYCGEYEAVLWLRATHEHYLADLVSIAGLLQLPERQQQQQDQQVLMRALLRWLQNHARWLLILDNVQEGVDVGDLLSVTHTGHILFTTRSRTIADLADNIELPDLTPEEGALLLLRVAHIVAPQALLDAASPDDVALATELSRLMDGLPLALDLAGAYIRETGYTLARYHQEYLHEQKRRIEMLSYKHSQPRAYSDYPESVATTWALSFRRVTEQHPTSIDLLQFCAFLSPDAIPESLILQGAPALTPLLQPLAGNLEGLNRTLIPLLNYSLLKRQADQSQLAMHRLVQEVVRNDLADLSDLPEREQERRRREHQRQWAKRTVEVVTLVFSAAANGSLQDFDRYVPHVLACTDLIEGKGLPDGRGLIEEAASLLLLDAADFWRRHAWYQRAVSFCQRALKMDEDVRGLEHPKTVKDRGMLGLVYDDMGKHTLAEQYHQHALALYNRRSDLAMHPDRARYLVNLATCYYSQGKQDQAEPLFKEAHAIFERAFGPEHYATLEALTWLATIDRDWGRYAEAEARYEQALAVYKRQPPPKQEVLAACLDNLAAVQDQQGQFERALGSRQRALAVLQQSLGADHPDVAHCLTNLADTYTELGEYKQAEACSRQALAIYERDGEEVHPDTAWQICRLATLAARRDQEREAETLFQRALTMIEQNWGPEHRDLAKVRARYAAFLHEQGRVDEASVLEERVRAIEAQTTEPTPSEEASK